MYTKQEVIDYIWQYSRYYGDLLISCKKIAKLENFNGHVTLIYLFNILENIIKSQVKNYELNFVHVINKLKEKNYISEIEYDFLNNNEYGIRRIRNLLAHSNLSKYNIIFLFEDKKLLFPLTEDATCTKFYEYFSDILFNLMLKIISNNFITPISINLDEDIKKLKIRIQEITPEELLSYKGIDYKQLKGWNEMLEDDKYKMAENASDVNIYTHIFKMTNLGNK
ncbi:hypothetical protein ACOL3B_03385 [Aliarcobacter butzleri]|uniref:hypothetical protein n=1 Tax=Aliarcobacter butzleri TaxID=28197 RepID=UPI00189E570A|nr:hypothetical protein [Aliarcobacter butzleri]MBF7065055.1 hypothetical protein [Aliarcobacter butzleri]MDN5111195.1 hypothetical protein [Aliarcobacter butzleri]